MIIDDLDLVRVAALESEADPPRPVDRDCPLALAGACSRMQADALQRADVIEPGGRIQDRQQFQRRLRLQPAKT